MVLPAAPASGGNYIGAKTVGQMVYLSGCISIGPDGLIAGTAGADRTIEEGYAAARACALIQLARLKQHLGSLDAIAEIVSVNGYVNAANGFPDPPSVINGASDLSSKFSATPDATFERPSASTRCRATRSSSCR